MNAAALKKTEIVRELSLVPDNKLDKVQKYIGTLLKESKQHAKSSKGLKGVWSNKGFEKIVDLKSKPKKTR